MTNVAYFMVQRAWSDYLLSIAGDSSKRQHWIIGEVYASETATFIGYAGIKF